MCYNSRRRTNGKQLEKCLHGKHRKRKDCVYAKSNFMRNRNRYAISLFKCSIYNTGLLVEFCGGEQSCCDLITFTQRKITNHKKSDKPLQEHSRSGSICEGKGMVDISGQEPVLMQGVLSLCSPFSQPFKSRSQTRIH